MATLDTMTLLQRQMEVSGALRKPVKTEEDLLEIRITMQDLSAFITQVGRVSTKLQLPLELVFQCLMQLGLGSEVDFDKQHRSGAVPMHQAKVLNRNAALNAQNVEPKLRGAVDEATLGKFVHQSGILRNLLRMKVEDGNDLSMARKMIQLSEEYLNCIYDMAGGNSKTMFAIFMAVDEGEICTALGGSSQSSNGGLTSDPNSPLMEEMKPLPNNVIKGMTEEVKNIATGKIAVATRLTTLKTIEHWLQLLGDDQLAYQFTDILCALQDPLKVQLAEKRSLICRAACDVVSILCIRSRPRNFQVSKAKECFHAWCDVLLKGVHVTVAAIATATDAVLRDVIVSSEGASFICLSISSTFQRAMQPELKRKCLNFLVLGLSARLQFQGANRIGEKEYLSLFSVAAHKAVTSNDEGVRRVGRILTTVLLQADPTRTVLFNIDPKLQKLLDQEAPTILPHLDQIDAMEIVVLRYAEPSKASAFCDEKGIDNGKSPERSTPLASLKENDVALRRAPEDTSEEKKSSPPPRKVVALEPTKFAGASTKTATELRQKTSSRPSENLPPVTKKAATTAVNSIPTKKTSSIKKPPTPKSEVLFREEHKKKMTGGISPAPKRLITTPGGSIVPLSLKSLSGEFTTNCVAVDDDDDDDEPSPTGVPVKLLSSLKRRSSSRQADDSL